MGYIGYKDPKNNAVLKVLVQDGYFWKNEMTGKYEEVTLLNKEEADKCKEFMESIIEKKREYGLIDLLDLDYYDNIGRESCYKWKETLFYKKDSLIVKGNGLIYQYFKEEWSVTDEDYITELS